MAASRSLLDDDGQPSSGSPLQIGQIVSGKYRIERQIGRGGMGIVLAATHLQLEHLVAIKVMRRDLGMDEKALDRLLMEARSAARIRSEHVARVLDVGTLENGSPFIVMEYLDGENLADLLDREGALEIEQAAAFLMQCCLALAEVHAADMVHRDLKPGNLFIARLPDGSASIKIVDFGISKHIGSAREGAAATTSPQVLGSPYYMSPEQMRAERVDERSDIWGLGAILFEMLTGRPPFIGDTLPEVYAAVLNEAPPAVDSLRSGVPGGLDDVVQRCLEKDPAQRFCDVADLAEALAPFAGPSAQSVERVTRILTNPDPLRGRYSLLPGGMAPAQVGYADAGRPALGSGILESARGMEGMMAGDTDGGAEDGGAQRRSVPDGVLPSGTMLEPDAVQRQSQAPWRPSRPPMTAEFAALSATGVRTGRSARTSRGHLWLLAAGVGLLAGAGAWWIRSGGEDSRDRAGVERGASEPARTTVEIGKLAPGANLPQDPEAEAPAEPRVAPIVARPSGAASKAGGPSARNQAEIFSLKPLPRANQAATSSSATPERATRAAGSRPPDPRDELPLPPRAAPSRSAPGAEPAADDAWDPDSFGDRR